MPRKNIKKFCGKPIIAYSIEAALKSGVFAEVMVSTEDNEIAEIAIDCGATVPFMRSLETADDFAGTEEVMQEVVEEYANRDKTFEYLCCIYPCAPFVTADRLKQGYAELAKSDFDSIITVCQFPVPVEWAFDISSGEIVPKNKEALDIRSQDLTPLYFDAGQFYFCNIDKMIQTGSMMAGKSFPYVLPELEVQDIDSENDWAMAEMKYKLIREQLQ